MLIHFLWCWRFNDAINRCDRLSATYSCKSSYCPLWLCQIAYITLSMLLISLTWFLAEHMSSFRILLPKIQTLLSICFWCQDKRAKVNFHHRALLSEYNGPLLRSDHVNVNLVGPHPPSKGFPYLLTVVDRVTRWLEAIPLASTNTKDADDDFLSGWIICYGFPSNLPSDRGSQFTSQLWLEISPIFSKQSCTTQSLTISKKMAWCRHFIKAWRHPSERAVNHHQGFPNFLGSSLASEPCRRTTLVHLQQTKYLGHLS